MTATIAGWGTALPEQRLTNADLEARLDTSDEWIMSRTGIRERRVASPEETTASLGVDAGAAAIKHAGLTPGEIDLLILTTATPEQPMPATSAIVADGLGLSCGAFDVSAACAGYVYGLIVGSSLLTSSGLASVLVVGSETLTRVIDPDDRSIAVLFGDAAAATVLVPAQSPDRGVLAWDMGCDGSGASLIEIRAGGSRMPASAATVAAGDHLMRMDGSEVFRRAVRVVTESCQATLARAGVSPADVGLFVPHQANGRMIEAITARLGIPAERTMVNLDRYGNTSAASVPLALAEAVDAGRVADGDLVLVSGFGAGMAWASALLRWGA